MAGFGLAAPICYALDHAHMLVAVLAMQLTAAATQRYGLQTGDATVAYCQ